MDAVARAWLGFLALGAGLIHLALAIGAPLAVAAPLLVVGAAEFGWGVFAFTGPRIPVPRVARLLALAPILGWVLLLLAGGGLGVRALPMIVASLFDVALAIGISIVLRRAGRPAAPHRDGPLPARRRRRCPDRRRSGRAGARRHRGGWVDGARRRASGAAPLPLDLG